jgi:UDP-2,3-diacylglucosamine hydrolase
VLGNHDCHADFLECLNALSIHRPNFQVHEYYFQTGAAVFLHGDCANYGMTFKQHVAARAPWRKCERWPSVLGYPYELCDRLSMTELLHRLCFPKPIFARRVVRYLHTLPSGLPSDVRDIYLGHTHLPFQDFRWQNYRLHTTGSAIRGMESSILRFEIAGESTETSHEEI